MKRILLSLAAFLFLGCTSSKAQATNKPQGVDIRNYAPPKDSVIQITLNKDDYRALLMAIDLNIDSKKVSKEVVEFIIKNAALVPKK